MNKIFTCIDRYVPATSVLRNTENSIDAIQKLYQQSLIFRDWIIKHALNSEEYVVDDAMSSISENPVQNKVITNALNNGDGLVFTNGVININYGTGLKIGTSGTDEGKLTVDSSAIVPSISGTVPINVSGTNTKTISLNYSPQFEIDGGAIGLKTATDSVVGGIAVHGTSNDSNSRITSGNNYYGLMIQTYNSLNRGYVAVPNAGSDTKGVAKLYGDISNSNTDGAVTQSALKTAIDVKAPLASPALTGTPTAPTAATGTNTTQIATTAFVQQEISKLLDTINEMLN